jgi:hypothetical protein
MESANYKSFAIQHDGVDPDSLVRRKLTFAEYSALPESAKNWHLVENSQNVDAALAEHERETREAVRHAKSETRKIATNYEVKDRAALADLMIANGGEFSLAWPQFVTSRANTDRVLKYMRDNELLPYVESFIIAFKALAHEGVISIDPSKTGLTDDSTELTGERLQDAINSNPLLLSKATPDVVERRRLMRMPTKEFEAYQEKTNPKPLPFVIKQQIDVAFRTLESRHPEFRFNSDTNKERLLAHLNAHANLITAQTVEAAFLALKQAGELDLNDDVVARSEHATWTDFSNVEPKLRTDKQESLANKVARMNSDEFSEFISHPANRRAVNNL